MEIVTVSVPGWLGWVVAFSIGFGSVLGAHFLSTKTSAFLVNGMLRHLCRITIYLVALVIAVSAMLMLFASNPPYHVSGVGFVTALSIIRWRST